jgi:hypothetical protein
VDALSATRVPVTGTWLRHVPAGSDPLYRPPTPADGRWQRGTNVEGVYLAAEEATVWAEWYRWLAELEIEPLHGLPRELWRYRASLSSVADLTRAETLDAQIITHFHQPVRARSAGTATNSIPQR